MSLTSVETPRHPDPDTDRLRRTHARAIKELQDKPATGLKVVGTFKLADGVATTIKHGLGRAPAFVLLAPPRGPATVGMVEEIRAGQVDRAQVIVLKASGYGATVTLEVAVL